MLNLKRDINIVQEASSRLFPKEREVLGVQNEYVPTAVGRETQQRQRGVIDAPLKASPQPSPKEREVLRVQKASPRPFPKKNRDWHPKEREMLCVHNEYVQMALSWFDSLFLGTPTLKGGDVSATVALSGKSERVPGSVVNAVQNEYVPMAVGRETQQRQRGVVIDAHLKASPMPFPKEGEVLRAHKDATFREQPLPLRSEGTTPSKGGEWIVSAVQNEYVPRAVGRETQQRQRYNYFGAGVLALVVVFLMLGVAGYAQERLSLQDAIARTLQHNFDVKIADLAVRQAERNNTLGNAGFAPNVFLNATATESRNNVYSDLAAGGAQQNPNAKATGINPYLQINWTIFDGGKMFIVKKQLNEYEAISSSQLKLQVQTVVSRTIQMYAKVVWQQKQLIAVDTGLALAKVRMDIANLKFETGSGAKIDYLQARVDYNARQSDSLTFVANLTQAIDSLAELMGEQEDKTYITDDSLELNTKLEAVDKDRLKEVNLSLDVFRRNASISHLNADIANTYFLPSLSLGTGYNYNRTTNSTGFSTYTRSYGPNAALTLSLPLFEGGNLRRASKVASLQAMRDDLQYEKQNTFLGKQYRTAWLNYQVAVASYRLEAENIGYAKENLDVQLARFKVGIGTTLESRQAETDYVTALERLYTAAYNLKVNETLVLEIQNQLVK